MFKPVKLVIHELQKTPEQKEPVWLLSDALAGVTPNDYESIEKMVKSFSKEGIFNGIFDPAGSNLFGNEFLKYFNNGRSQQDFISFTKSTADQLLPFLQKKNFARGGFYVFCEYERDNAPYLGVFLVRDTEGTFFRRDEGSHSFQLGRTKFMEIDNMAMGCQIDYAAYRTAGKLYLTFTNNRQKEVSEYFVQWIGCGDRRSSRDSTTDFLKLLNLIKDQLPLDPSTEQPLLPVQFMEKVFEMTDSKKSKEVDLKHIGSHYFEDAAFLVQQAQAHSIPLDTRFKYHKATFDKENIIEVKDDDLSIKLKFPKHRFSNARGKVRIAGEGPNRILVIESQHLIDEIEKKLGSSPNGNAKKN